MKQVTVTMRAALMALACAGVVWTVTTVTRAVGPTINLSPFATSFNNPIGIDFFEPTVGSGKLIATAFYPSGDPLNFELIDAVGVHSQFSTLHFLPQELKVATVRASSCTGGFPVGAAYAGNGIPGQILKINPDATFVNPWATLPGETNQVRGSLYQDRACAVGGDLVVVTGNEQSGTPGNDFAGNVWRINSFGVPTKVATINRHLEGVITLPGDADGQAKYGPLAGNIIAGDEDLIGPNFNTYGPNGRLWVIAPNGAKWTVGVPYDGTIMNYPTDVPLHIEDIDLIPRPRPGLLSPEGDLFAVDFGGSQILHAPASDFADKCGDILLSQEFRTAEVASGFSTLKWDAGQQKFVVTPLTNTGPATLGHFEHVTFWGGTECAPPNPSISIVKLTNTTDNDVAPGPTVLLGSTVTWTYKVTNTGNVTLTGVAVTDDKVGAITCPQTTLAAGASMTCTKSGIALAGQYTNVGTVTGNPPAGPPVTSHNPDNYFGADPNVRIVKLTNGTNNDVPPGPTVLVGSTVTWTYNVTNTGNVTLTNVVVTDDKVGAICTVASLLPGASASCTKSGIAVAGQYTNTGTVTGTPPVGPPVTSHNPDNYFGADPRIRIIKLTNGTDNDAGTGPIVAAGSTVTWTYNVTNTGNVTLTGVAVTDDKVGAITCPQTTLAAGASMTCTKTGIAVAGQYTNTGSVTGTPPLGPNVTSSNPDHYFGQGPPPACFIGYPFTSSFPRTSVIFNESEVLQSSTQGPDGTIRLWAADEHAILLGVANGGFSVSPLSTNPGHVSNPMVGDVSQADPSGRPFFPTLYVTDITGLTDNAGHTSAAIRAGDWQFGAAGNPAAGTKPSDVYGTWKGATIGIVDKKKGTMGIITDADPAKNTWNGIPDTPPGGFAALTNQGYGHEARWNPADLRLNDLPLISGHTYRLLFMVHDGDQNKTGGDVGEACLNIVKQ